MLEHLQLLDCKKFNDSDCPLYLRGFVSNLNRSGAVIAVIDNKIYLVILNRYYPWGKKKKKS